MRLQEVYKKHGKGTRFTYPPNPHSPTWVMEKKISRTQYIVHTLGNAMPSVMVDVSWIKSYEVVK